MKMFYTPDELEQAKADTKEYSETHRCAAHLCHALDHREQPCYVISDWYDGNNRVASYENGRCLF